MKSINLNEVKPVNGEAFVDLNERNKRTDGSLVRQKYCVMGLEWPHARTLRAHISRALRNYIDSGMKAPQERRRQGVWRDYLGCGIMTFAEKLQDQFHGDMSWDNYGQLWELSYIIPLSEFDMSNNENMMKAFNFINLQPRLCVHRPTPRRTAASMIHTNEHSASDISYFMTTGHFPKK